MSRLAAEIRQCMCDLTESGDTEVTARFRFPGEFTGFQGHFPGRPVLPAVCEVQAALAILEAWKKKSVRLREIILAKFSKPVTRDEELVYSCTLAMEEGRTAAVRTTVARDGREVARFRLRVVFEDGEEGC